MDYSSNPRNVTSSERSTRAHRRSSTRATQPSFVQEFGLLVGRSLVRADAEDWKIPTARASTCTTPTHVQNSQQTAHATHRLMVTLIPARTRIARVEDHH